MNTEIVFQQILNLNELIVTYVYTENQRINIYCCSAFNESLCPCCLGKCTRVNQKYRKLLRDLSISGKAVYLHLESRQFHCPDCNRFFTEGFSFAPKHSHYTDRYMDYLFLRVRHSSAKQAGVEEDICWKTVNRIFNDRASNSLATKEDISKVKALGIDEFSLKKGHRDFAAVIVDLENLRVTEVLPYRDKARLIKYFRKQGKAWCEGIEVFCSDMWEGFINGAREVFPNAEVVVDRFHFFMHMNRALDNQRKELRRKQKDREELKHIKWLLLKNFGELPESERETVEAAFDAAPELKDLHGLKEGLREIFEKDIEKKEAETLLSQWSDRAKSLKNKYMDKFISTFENWKDHLINYFRTRLTTSIVEGMNNKIKVIKRQGFGFRNFGNFRLRILAAFD